ncbi:DUF4163 domain-containing protein [Flavivirga aquimarina]|uniref:DUF4163 domain-containing protein n=1 Tax=Flavivirga aquimarina TaxID=2027862 RepID=A0ABT8W9R7_9FLAO|nr:DUF3298 and DUF4163 domain-containing protein [Flavivirga aquimarina]MDO5969883.1 DUF4163 domain-containing protein [Flavivirga aquimarina]
MTCKDEVELSFSEINLSTSNNNLVEVNIPNAIGNENITNRINSTIEKTVIGSLHVGGSDNITSKSIEESITAFNKEFQIFKTDFPEIAEQWDAQIDGEVLLQSSEIISIAITSYIYAGGAHGTVTISFLNFETITGHIILNNNLFKDVEGFKKVAKSYFDKAIKDKDVFLDTTTFELPENMAYNEDGIVLLYNTYEVAPYSTGIIEFVIPFEEISSFLHFNSF